MKQFFKRILNKRKVFIFSGAGISQESGISTFRDKDGLWERYRTEDVCDFRTWQKNYTLVHDFYNARRTELANVNPNEAHRLVAELQRKLGVNNVINVTTNIDDLFERAGVKNTFHLHGTLTQIKDIRNDEVTAIGHQPFDYASKDRIFKPDVVFFNEACLQYRNLAGYKFQMNEDDIVITIGMSFLVVKPERLFSAFVKTKNININLDSSTNDAYRFDECYNERATEALAKIVAKI
jgi:NAD-dependent deacetylase